MTNLPFKTGDIGFVRTEYKWYDYRTWLAPFIRFFDKVYFNHVFIIVEDKGIFYRYESTERGIEKNLLIEKTLKEDNIVLFVRPTFEVTKKNMQEMSNLCEKFKGTPYDWNGTLVHQLIYQSTGKWIGKKDDTSQNKLYCSEFVILVMHYVFGKEQFKNAYKTSPGTILEMNCFIEYFRGKLQISNFLLKI
jgi:hypothetical protein